MISIVSVGDIMPGGLLSDSSRPCANQEVIELLASGDIRCGTLECAFGNKPTYDKAKVADRGNVIYAKDNNIKRLKELQIDIVSLANNHFYDLGVEGAIHTIDLLDKNGILHCGAGANLKEAGKPVVMEFGIKKVAFLAFCDTNYNNVYYCTYATENSPGINPMNEEYVIDEIMRYANLYDYVVVLAHWGTENTFFPNISTYKMANKMLKAGACLVLGSHPHRVQPVLNVRNGSVVFSMGNFLFPERLIAPPKVTYYPEGPIDYSSLPVTNKYPIVHTITLKTLPYLARVGMIVNTCINGSTIISSYRYTFLDNENYLQLLDEQRSNDLNGKLRNLELPLKYNYYSFYKIYKKGFRSVKNKLKKIKSTLK